MDFILSNSELMFALTLRRQKADLCYFQIFNWQLNTLTNKVNVLINLWLEHMPKEQETIIKQLSDFTFFFNTNASIISI